MSSKKCREVISITIDNRKKQYIRFGAKMPSSGCFSLPQSLADIFLEHAMLKIHYCHLTCDQVLSRKKSQSSSQ